MKRSITAFAMLFLCVRSLAARADLDLPASMHLTEDGATLVQDGGPPSELYDPTVVRSFALRFDQPDWWEQLTANYASEQNIAADLTVDGITYPQVGVRFKGMTSYRMVQNSQKKSFNVELDFVDGDQSLMGYRTLNLHNAHLDATFMREVLYFEQARRYVPCPRACYVQLSINGEDWGLYVHVQQLNAELLEEWFLSSDGARWKAPMMAGGGATPTPATGDTTRPAPGVPDDSTRTGPTGIPVPGDSTWAGPPTRPPTAPTLEQWLASAVAVDLDGDGQITEADYRLFLAALQQAAPPTAGKALQTRPGGGGAPGGTGGGGFGASQTALVWLGSDSAAYQAVYELKTNGLDDPWTPLIQACDVLNNTSIDSLAQVADSGLAVDRWLWFLAVENVFTDDDSYLTKGADYQLYYEAETGRIHPLEHDGNESFATRSARLSPLDGEDDAGRPAISRLLAVPEFRQRYLAHVRTLLDESFDWDVLGPRVEAYRALVESRVQADPKKLYTYDEFVSGLAELQNLVTTRRQYLLGLAEVSGIAPTIAAVSGPPSPAAAASRMTAGVGDGDLVIADLDGQAAATVLLHWGAGVTGMFASVPMYDDGAHGDGTAGDGRYAALLPAPTAGRLVRYYVEARATDGATAFSPARAEPDAYVFQAAPRVATTPTVVINELMADNGTSGEDPQGDHDDWVELYNASEAAVDLSGVYLSDTGLSPRQWSFPPGTVIQPHAYLLVWADEDEGDDPGLHASFKLSRGGEAVYLVDADARGNAILDFVAFGEQETDRSLGRLPDGSGAFQVLALPTPGGPNDAATAVAEEVQEALPARFALGQNYPNPFNSGTVIPFALPEAGVPIELAVYDLLGQRVATLAAGELAAGEHRLTWDGRGDGGRPLASGVYLCSLTAGARRACRRLVLLR